jgi:hypothetical protein
MPLRQNQARSTVYARLLVACAKCPKIQVQDSTADFNDKKADGRESCDTEKGIRGEKRLPTVGLYVICTIKSLITKKILYNQKI